MLKKLPSRSVALKSEVNSDPVLRFALLLFFDFFNEFAELLNGGNVG